ncbi:uncharacterized protein LOC132727945 isoform X2 [Ruditapes philippinarum]|uniref:uncharacterized protein LOC132727945 isoform X2 n=1 Tax=Ruditapes philippinarum TaxID=129788 RepID=UPI00295B48D3|nr:uncharacterized protein LOC132727945 isoform X2 [Ruditapes philippinarum]
MTEEEAIPADIDVIAKCTCKIKTTDYNVRLTDTEFRWHISGNKQLKGLQVVRVVDILAVTLDNSTKTEIDKNGVSVSYVKQGKKLILKLCCVTFTSGDSQIVSNLYQQISTLIRKIEQRPRKLLVLINPVSGRSKGRSTYEQKVAPIFKEAGIETDVIVTQRAHHTEEILSTYDLNSINGLVLVGGDGLYQECVNGLMRRLATEQNVNIDDPDETVPAIDIPIGVIPCGTGNGIALGCYGNCDVITAALAIAIGYESPANIMSVHSDDKLLTYSVLMTGYGLWGDIINSAESRRNQGVFRYAIAFAEYAFIKNQRRLQLSIQHYSGESLRQVKNKTQTTEAGSYLNETTMENNTGTETDVWTNSTNCAPTTTTESVVGTVIFVSSPIHAFSTTTKPDLSRVTMYMNKSSHRTKFMSFLFQLMTTNFNALDSRDDITTLHGQEWKIKLENPSLPETENSILEHIINIDGEVFRLSKLEFHTKLLTDRIKLFSNMPYFTKR